MLELRDVLAQGNEVLLLVLALNEMICSILLVAGNEIFVVDGLPWLVLGHEGRQLVLQLVVEHLRAPHCPDQVLRVDVPASNHQVLGAQQGQDLIEAQVDLAVLRVGHLHGGALGH